MWTGGKRGAAAAARQQQAHSPSRHIPASTALYCIAMHRTAPHCHPLASMGRCGGGTSQQLARRQRPVARSNSRMSSLPREGIIREPATRPGEPQSSHSQAVTPLQAGRQAWRGRERVSAAAAAGVQRVPPGEPRQKWAPGRPQGSGARTGTTTERPSVAQRPQQAGSSRQEGQDEEQVLSHRPSAWLRHRAAPGSPPTTRRAVWAMLGCGGEPHGSPSTEESAAGVARPCHRRQLMATAVQM